MTGGTCQRPNTYKKVLTCREDQALAEVVLWYSDRGDALTPCQVSAFVIQLCDESGRQHPILDKWRQNGCVGRHWWDCWVKSHPEISLRKPSQLSNSRAVVCKEQIDSFHDIIDRVWRETPTYQAMHIYNLDETCILPCGAQQRVLGRKGTKTINSRTNNCRDRF